ncbi:hypothetical protein DFH07DRAFT_984776 [Mycena maculata]|uniref:Cohesin loading factor n=1 Tax=Mycena maculata TaxID=230809 RepID=A0AAD7NUL6_9AGAR|nr:hypothetical protein DFH07DRAFT_984776 [Mycena maculata]
MEDNPRPQKRVRITPPTDVRVSSNVPESQLRGPQLLLALPSLLVHPPTNSAHTRALCISLLALRRCLDVPNPGYSSGSAGNGACDLNPPDECRAWCALAEIGLSVLEGGFGAEAWAAGIEGEVERALGKALIIAQKHPALVSYAPYLTRLSARAAPQRARQLLRPTLGLTLPTAGNATVHYYTHLAWVDHLLQALLYPPTTPSKPALKPARAKSATATPTKSTTLTREKEIARDLVALRAALNPLLSASHVNIALLARLIELRTLIALGRWVEVAAALERAEAAMGVVFPVPPAGKGEHPLYTTSPFHAALVVHVLVLGVVWFVYAVAPPASGAESGPCAGSTAVSARLTLLYTLLDAGVYNGKCRTGADGQSIGPESEGVLEVPLDASTPPLYIRTTHPRVLYALGYLVSAVARRDLVGRKPKRKTFLQEGLGVVNREAGRELRVPRWANAGEVRAVELQMEKVKADLMCELVGVCIMRSEFADAEQTLNAVIAHARTHGLFAGALAHRIALLHAHLAHALGRPTRARTCYRVAAQLAEEAGDAGGAAAARAGEVALLVGLRARARLRASGRTPPPLAEEEAEVDIGEAELVRFGREVAAACRVLGGAMRAVGEVLEGVLTGEILKAKQHLKNALSYATECQDNHLRALILAMIAAHYLHTAGEQAQLMLATCEQLAAGLGAPGKKGKDRVETVGNAPLRLWAGERFLELHKRDGRDDLIQKREEANGVLRQAVVALSQRAS